MQIVEPPNLPIVPIAPKRRLLALVGLMIAVVGGLGTAAIAEVLDQSVSNPRHLTAITGAAPLVVIPHIKASAARRGVFSSLIIWSVSAATILGGVDRLS